MAIDPKLEHDFTLFDYNVVEREVIYRRWCREHGISYVMFQVLSRLMHIESIAPSELADDFGISRQSMTSILDSLESGGYIERTPHPTDRRKKLVRLTADGKRYVQESFGQVHQQEMAAYTSLSEEDRETLGRLRRAYISALSRNVE